MNERIRELAIESQLVYEDSGRLLTGWLEHVDLSDEVKKFAELIVGKCAEYAEHAKGIDVDYQKYFKELLFGVE
jgi:hypothetical protein